ncbi:DUF2231 domain-containing protein [Nocardioides sp.]|uniref:DUF2231 domain-containing protein n=1 Tax=Nocardioides sp. TaxID=35761 RepID=UPI0027362899|nr:DUF2231 domain-containing protein [Nocardioides sp.]MDP3894311.1 hypothetical protein [Nocardioides sp.]
MDIAGLPLHALIVHAAVVFAPLAALAAIVFAVMPRWRWLLRWPVLVLALVATGSVVLAYLSGKDHLDNNPGLIQLPDVVLHQDRAEILLWVTLAFAVLVVAATALLGGPTALASGRGDKARRAPSVETTLGVLVVIASLVVLVYAVLTGDAGARAKWG